MQNTEYGTTSQQVVGLVQRAQDGEDDAFAELYELFYGKVYRYVYFKTGKTEEAEDISEEVFLRMLESIQSFRWKGATFSSWLFRIAHNLIVDYFRKNHRDKTTPIEEIGKIPNPAAIDIESQMDFKRKLQEVRLAMKNLTKLQQDVLAYRFAAGFSLNETATAMDKNTNAVKALQHAAIKNLRNLVTDNNMIAQTNTLFDVRSKKRTV